jgi:indolepyruvate ferredoxin oxidoreductase beta subunit
MKKTLNILLAGVGGQGTILAGKVLSRWAMICEYDVKYSEIHGMAQRGGSVVTQVRVGEKIYSPVIEVGEADYIVAFEQLEAMRMAHMLNKKGIIIFSTQVIEPMPVLMGAAKYPENIPSKLKKFGEIYPLDAVALAEETGNPKASNIVLLGKLARLIDRGKEEWRQAIRDSVKPRFYGSNLKAFDLGWGTEVDG